MLVFHSLLNTHTKNLCSVDNENIKYLYGNKIYVFLLFLLFYVPLLCNLTTLRRTCLEIKEIHTF